MIPAKRATTPIVVFAAAPLVRSTLTLLARPTSGTAAAELIHLSTCEHQGRFPLGTETEASRRPWQAEWEVAGRYAEILPSVARARGLPQTEIPDEERIVLVLVNLLLRHEAVRALVPLPPPISRFGVAVTRPETGAYRSADAPVFDEVAPEGEPTDR